MVDRREGQVGVLGYSSKGTKFLYFVPLKSVIPKEPKKDA